MVTTYTAADGAEQSLPTRRVICWGIQLWTSNRYLRTRGEDPGEHHPVRCLDSSIVEPLQTGILPLCPS